MPAHFLASFFPSPRVPSHHDLSNARTPQNCDSYELANVGGPHLLFKPGAIFLDCFYTYLQLRGDFRGCFAITK
jgi:hypothetical protein